MDYNGNEQNIDFYCDEKEIEIQGMEAGERV